MSTHDCKGWLLNTTTKLEPIESHLTLKNPETRNSIYQTIKSHTGLNTDRYRIYITSDYDLIIFLTEGLTMPSDIEELKVGIIDIDNLIMNVDIFTSEEFDSNVFSINPDQDFIGGRSDFEAISFTMPTDLVIPDKNEVGRFTIDLLNEIGHDPDFDKTLLSLIGVETWGTMSTISSISKRERTQSVSETVALFAEQIDRYDESSGFKDGLENLANHFKKEVTLKYTSGISDLIFDALATPFSIHYAKTPFYTHIHIKLYLLLYISFKQHILRELLKSESVKAMKNMGSSRYLVYLEKIEGGEEVNSDLLNNFLDANKNISISMLRKALTTTKGETSRAVAQSIGILFSVAHKPINKYLELMGFGKLTYMP